MKVILLVISTLTFCAFACTNFLITKGASVENSNYITYAADSHVLFGELYKRDAADYPAGAMMDIVEWDTGRPLGQIPQANHTYSVIGNMNEYQVAIGETTFGGREELVSETGLVDYGSLIWIALQRSKTARQAIQVMTSIVAEYGYASSGESFSIMDKDEVWLLELIGKGKQHGAVWAAQRIPDGYISSHANQARITQLIKNNTDLCMYSKDVISFAREMKYFSGTDDEFSFSDTYNPVTFSGARGCDMRAYAFFSDVLGDNAVSQYYDYALGKIKYNAHGYATNRMPLYFAVPSSKRISTRQVMKAMRNHFEGLTIDLHDVPGTGPNDMPYRWRPMDFKVKGKTYTNERSAATQQTGFSFVAQARSGKAHDKLGGIFWFGVDDTAQTVYVPFFCGHNEVPLNFKKGNGDLLTYSATSMFWLIQRISNHAYLRYNEAIVDINKAQDELEDSFISQIPNIDSKANSMYKSLGVNQTAEFLTEVSNTFTEAAFKRLQELEIFLLVKYIDGNTKHESNGSFLRDQYGVCEFPAQKGYPSWFYEGIVDATGDLHLDTSLASGLCSAANVRQINLRKTAKGI